MSETSLQRAVKKAIGDAGVSKSGSCHTFQLAVALEHPFYDCLYIATAIEMDGALVTADLRLAEAARGTIDEVELLGG